MRDAPENIEFGGYRSASGLAEEFRRADIFCSPSVWEEPFGLVNVEAMACALPVVATRGGGVPEVFAGGGGILVERGSANELASALEKLIVDRSLRLELAMEGYRSFQRKFTWKTVHRRYREVLASLDEAEGGSRESQGGQESGVDSEGLEEPCQVFH
jgi:glycosyltransferase involved in cell wall biosynthesis